MSRPESEPDPDAADEDPSTLRRVYRTVTPGFVPRPDAEMDAVGWAVFLGLVVLLVPLLPFIVVVWLVERALEAAANR